MIPFATVEAAEAALERPMTWAEAAWFRYSGSTPDYCLCFQNFVILFAAYTLAALPVALLELCAPAKLTTPYKLQPKNAGIRTGLPLPSAWEVAAQLLVYMLMEDYLGYWFHRLMHSEWAYDNIHRVHHEYTAPMGFAAAHLPLHWFESLMLGLSPVVVMVIVPCHITTCWLRFAIGGFVYIETHCGFDFPFSPSKIIPFYGGAEFHDYHHHGAKWSHSNFAPFFTFCDYIYGTDKGYRHHKASLVKLKDTAVTLEKEDDGSKSRKED